MDREDLRRQLLQTFASELDEHVDGLNATLLELESATVDAQRLEHVRALLRRIHSLKGSARAVDLLDLEHECHAIEQELEPFSAGRRALDRSTVERLFAFSDVVADARRSLANGTEREAGPADARAERAAPAIEAAVRISPEKLDSLLSQSGELVVTQRRIARWREELERSGELLLAAQTDCRRAQRALAGEHGKDELAELGRKLAVLTRTIDGLGQVLASDERVMHQVADRMDHEVRRVRMLPFAEACRGLGRVVRDAAKSVGKDAALDLDDQDVEIDRAILQQLKDPILHLCRNCVVHGLEAPEVRARAGKPSAGRVTVRARVRGAEVEVSVKDDGAGLDLAAIQERARQKGLQVPSNMEQAAATIFLPGFSTARSVDHLAGRGVGLDVVREQVETLHGRVSVQSEPSVGTEFTLILPLTISTVRVLLVVAGGQTFAVPSTGVLSIQRTARNEIQFAEGKEIIFVNDAPLPMLSLATALGVRNRLSTLGSDRVQTVILVAGSQRVAVAVEQLVAEQEVIVKPLGARLRGLANIAGAAILPTGEITLILHVANLFRASMNLSVGGSVSSSMRRERQKRRHVLVVDDSVTTRSVHRAVLETADYQVTLAANGEEAWQILQGSRFDAVVSDVEMPRMDGFALTQMIRRSPGHSALPVVLVTALEKQEERARGLEVGASAYLVKSSFERDSLVKTLERFV